MKSAFLILAILAATALVASEASARMGETLAQCDRRYGMQNQSSGEMFPLISGVTNRTYVYQGWRITAAFIKGRAAMLRYTKTNNARIQDDEAQAILRAETYGGEWKRISQYSWNPAVNLQNSLTKPRLWTNPIGAEAYFSDPLYISFVVKAPVVEQYNKAKSDAAEQRRKATIPEF